MYNQYMYCTSNQLYVSSLCVLPPWLLLYAPSRFQAPFVCQTAVARGWPGASPGGDRGWNPKLCRPGWQGRDRGRSPGSDSRVKKWLKSDIWIYLNGLYYYFFTIVIIIIYIYCYYYIYIYILIGYICYRRVRSYKPNHLLSGTSRWAITYFMYHWY